MLQLFFTLVNDLCNKHTRNVKGFLFITEFEKVTLFSHNGINYDLYGIMNTLNNLFTYLFEDNCNLPPQYQFQVGQ